MCIWWRRCGVCHHQGSGSYSPPDAKALQAKEKVAAAIVAAANNTQQQNNNNKKLTRKEKAAAAKARKALAAKAAENAQAATDGKKDPDCLICREAGIPDGQRGHYFSDCPILKKMRSKMITKKTLEKDGKCFRK